jgi:hypothetical protein
MTTHARPHLRLVPGPGLAKTRARAIDARIGEILAELGRMADEAVSDDQTFSELAAAVGALGRARMRLRDPR